MFCRLGGLCAIVALPFWVYLAFTVDADVGMGGVIVIISIYVLHVFTVIVYFLFLLYGLVFTNAMSEVNT